MRKRLLITAGVLIGLALGIQVLGLADAQPVGKPTTLASTTQLEPASVQRAALVASLSPVAMSDSQVALYYRGLLLAAAGFVACAGFHALHERRTHGDRHAVPGAGLGTRRTRGAHRR